MKYALVVAIVVAGLGVGAFFAANALLLQSAEPPSMDEATDALEADRLAPLFDGVVAGLRIVPKQGQQYPYDMRCTTEQWDEWGGVEPGYTTGTEIDIPAISGYDIVAHQVAWCDGRVAFNSVRMTSLNQDVSVTVVRVLADPVLRSDIPAERVTEVTVNGRAAAYVQPIRFGDGLFVLSKERLYIVEDFGITNISLEGRGDILDIARQVVGGDR